MRKADLLLRQRGLQLRSQQLRDALARDARALARPLNPFDAASAALARCLRQPGLPLAALAILLLSRRMGGPALGLAQRLWWLWRGWRSLRLWLRG
jgi:hypothetical protein